MRKILSLLIIFYSSTMIARDYPLPDLTCGTTEQNAVIEISKSDRIATVYMTSGGYTDSFDLYQTKKSKIYCEDDADTRMCFFLKKGSQGKSHLYFLKDGVKIDIAQVNCRRISRKS